MLNLKEIFTIVLALVFFITTIDGKEKATISIMIFLLPFGVVFSTKLIPIGLNGMLIWSIWLALKAKNNINRKSLLDWVIVTKKVYYFFYFIVIGILLGLMQSTKLDTFTQISEASQIINFTLFLITVIFLIKILVNFRDDPTFQKRLILFFSCSIFLQLISYALPFIGFSAFTESVQQRSVVEFNDVLMEEDVKRFAGVLGDYELIIDYALIIIALCFFNIMNNYKKLLYSIIALTSIAVALASGTRSFIIIILTFFLVYFFLSLIYLRSKGSLRKLYLNYLLLAIVSYLIINSYSDLSIFERFNSALGIYDKSGDLNEATNRHLIMSLPVFLENTTIFGNGSLYFNQLAGDEMVSHNLLMAIYAKYGIIGAYIILVLFFKPIYILIKQIQDSKNVVLKRESIIYIALLFSLFLQELKISALRYQTTMLIYVFMFMLVFFQISKNNVANKN